MINQNIYFGGMCRKRKRDRLRRPWLQEMESNLRHVKNWKNLTRKKSLAQLKIDTIMKEAEILNGLQLIGIITIGVRRIVKLIFIINLEKLMIRLQFNNFQKYTDCQKS